MIHENTPIKNLQGKSMAVLNSYGIKGIESGETSFGICSDKSLKEACDENNLDTNLILRDLNRLKNKAK